jgi:chromosome partitioning protein
MSDNNNNATTAKPHSPATARAATGAAATPARAPAATSTASAAAQTRAPQTPGVRIFCVANQKGGVGKTTTTVNLAAGLAQIGLRVLVVDLDPQGNATMGSGINKRELPKTIYDVLLEPAAMVGASVRSPKGGYAVLGANRELAGAEVELVPLPERERRLRQALALVQTEYDFVLIDCPPSLSLLTLNGLVAAHGVIVPMQCEYFALEGLSDLVNTVKQVHANLNPDLQLIGLLRVMFDPRITLQQQVSDQLKSHFGDKVFNTVIPRNVRLAEAPSYGLPGVVFDPASRGAVAFVEFARELAQRLK